MGYLVHGLQAQRKRCVNSCHVLSPLAARSRMQGSSACSGRSSPRHAPASDGTGPAQGQAALQQPAAACGHRLVLVQPLWVHLECMWLANAVLGHLAGVQSKLHTRAAACEAACEGDRHRGRRLPLWGMPAGWQLCGSGMSSGAAPTPTHFRLSCDSELTRIKRTAPCVLLPLTCARAAAARAQQVLLPGLVRHL